MMTKLSLIDSSSSSLKYSMRTEERRCRKMITSAAFELRFERASTVFGTGGVRFAYTTTIGNEPSYDTDCCVGCAYN